jgi:3-oxoacyl-[acyl-carrier protein] reductase
VTGLPDIDLQGRVVIMTGGDRGLGRAMALALAGAGAKLVLASPEAGGLAAVAAELEAASGQAALAVPADITDPASSADLVAATLEAFGHLDVLFNNARRFMRGPGLPAHGNSLTVFETDPDIYRETVMVNVVGTFNMTRAALAPMMEKGAGKIINLTTSLRNFYQPRNSPYGVTKAAEESETAIWAADLAETGVTVNSLLPGGACDSDPNRVKQPGQTLLPVDIMDPLAVWLASAGSDGITGCRFVGRLWDAALPPDEAAQGAREDPVFQGQPRP